MGASLPIINTVWFTLSRLNVWGGRGKWVGEKGGWERGVDGCERGEEKGGRGG